MCRGDTSDALAESSRVNRSCRPRVRTFMFLVCTWSVSVFGPLMAPFGTNATRVLRQKRSEKQACAALEKGGSVGAVRAYERPVSTSARG